MEGEITQFGILSVSQVPLLRTTIPSTDVFVKVTVELMQLIVSGEIEKFAMGGIIVVIGSTAPSRKPQGFSARILT